MKRTCHGCRALKPESFSLTSECHGFKCGLGYDMDRQKLKPLQLCPKPKTIFELEQELILLRTSKRMHKS